MQLCELTPENFPRFIDKLNLGSTNHQSLPGNLLTVALLHFLQENAPDFAARLRRSRIKATTDMGESYACLFLGVGPVQGEQRFSALGLTEDSPDAALFRDRLVPGSLDMEDQWHALLADPKMPQALALIEAAVLRMLPVPINATPSRPRF